MYIKKGKVDEMVYVKSASEACDLFSIFTYRFNEEEFLKKTSADPVEFEQKVQAILNNSSINDELFMFFYILNGKNSFIESKFLLDWGNDFSSPDYIREVCDKIRAMDIFGEILKFYVEDNNAIEQNMLSVDYLYGILRDSDIPDKIKFHIIHLNFNRNHYTELLISEINAKYDLLKKYYFKKSKFIDDNKELLLKDKVQIDLCGAAGISSEYRNDYCFSVSCLYDKFIATLPNNGKTCIVIGYETVQQLEELSLTKNDVDVCMTCKALSDNLRVDIVNLIKEKGEMSTTEIARTFDKGLTAMFYHLNMLYDSQVLTIRNEGRTVFYDVNNSYLTKFSSYIKKFVNEPTIKF